MVDITKDFEILRYVKSQWEMEMTARAYEIADAGFKKIIESVVEGKREYEAAAEAEYIQRKMGGEGQGYRTIMGTEERAIGIISPAHEKIPGIRVETAYKTTSNGCVPFSHYMEKLFGF